MFFDMSINKRESVPHNRKIPLSRIQKYYKIDTIYEHVSVTPRSGAET